MQRSCDGPGLMRYRAMAFPTFMIERPLAPGRSHLLEVLRNYSKHGDRGKSTISLIEDAPRCAEAPEIPRRTGNAPGERLKGLIAFEGAVGKSVDDLLDDKLAKSPVGFAVSGELRHKQRKTCRMRARRRTAKRARNSELGVWPRDGDDGGGYWGDLSPD